MLWGFFIEKNADIFTAVSKCFVTRYLRIENKCIKKLILLDAKVMDSYRRIRKRERN